MQGGVDRGVGREEHGGVHRAALSAQRLDAPHDRGAHSLRERAVGVDRAGGVPVAVAEILGAGTADAR